MNYVNIQRIFKKRETRLGILEVSSCADNYIIFLIVIRGLRSINGLVIEESNNIDELVNKVKRHSILDEVNVILVQREEHRDIATRILPSKKVVLVKDICDVMPDIKFYVRFLTRIREKYLKILECK